MSPEEKELFNEFTTTIEAIESSVYEKKLEPLVKKTSRK